MRLSSTCFRLASKVESTVVVSASTTSLAHRRHHVVSFDLIRVSVLPVVAFRHNRRCRRLSVDILKSRRLCRK